MSFIALTHPRLHIFIRYLDQRGERLLIYLTSRPELHVAHALAAAFEKPGWTQHLRTLG